MGDTLSKYVLSDEDSDEEEQVPRVPLSPSSLSRNVTHMRRDGRRFADSHMRLRERVTALEQAAEDKDRQDVEDRIAILAKIELLTDLVRPSTSSTATAAAASVEGGVVGHVAGNVSPTSSTSSRYIPPSRAPLHAGSALNTAFVKPSTPAPHVDSDSDDMGGSFGGNDSVHDSNEDNNDDNLNVSKEAVEQDVVGLAQGQAQRDKSPQPSTSGTASRKVRE